MSNAFWQVWLGQSANSNPAGSGADASINSNVLKQSYVNRFLDVSGTLTVRYDASINGNLSVGPLAKFGLGIVAPVYTLDQSGTHRIQCPVAGSATTTPDANPGNNGLVFTSTKASGGTNFSMGLGIDFSTGNGYINTGYNSGGSSAQPLILQATGGDVGIGSATPTAALTVVGNQNITGTITGPGGSTYNAGAFYTGGNTVASFLNAVTINSGVTNAAVIELGSLNRDILSTATANVTYKYALAYHTNSTGGDFEIKAITSGATYASNGTPASRLYITAAGNIGIGKTNPQYNLDVNGSARFVNNVTVTTAGESGLTLQDTTTATSGYARFLSTNGSTYIQSGQAATSGSAAPIYFTSMFNNNIWMTLSATGYLGIGTTSPSGQLHVFRGSAGTIATLAGNGGGGNQYNLDLCSYINPSGTPTNRISVIDDGAFSGHITFSSKTTGSENNTMNEWMRIKSNGYVGIGTTNPTNFLQIACNSSTAGSNPPDGGANHGIVITSPKTGSTPYSMGLGVDYAAGYGYINCAGNNAYQPLCLQARGGGNVGIGTTNPSYTLDVAGNGRFTAGLKVQGSLAENLSTYGAPASYINSGGGGSWASSPGGYGGSGIWGIWCQSRLACSEVWANSDRRIKTTITDIDGTESLTLLRQFQPKTYKYIDFVGCGPRTQYGFIAQEIQPFFPDGLNNVSDSFIPNIYENTKQCDKTTIVLNNKTTDLFGADSNGLDPSGNPVKLLLFGDNNNRFETTITSILDEKTFTIKDSVDSTILFVYGTEVSDFHHINYQHINTISFSALKEIDVIVQTQQSQIQKLESENVDLKSRLASIEARLISAGF